MLTGNAELEGTHLLDTHQDQPHSVSRLVNDAVPPSPAPRIVRNGRINPTAGAHGHVLDIDFSALDLVCPIDADAISNRWLNPYIAAPGQKSKNYPANTTAFIFRMLKSYSSVAVHGRGLPPFVHSKQVQDYFVSPALSTCLTLLRTCERSDPGSHAVVVDLLNREMDRIYGLCETYNDTALLAAFQAYLLYTMVLCFELGEESTAVLRQAMANLQVLASFACGRGIVCSAEQQRTRPKWETWIVAEAKRRSIYIMYMFDSMLAARDGLPTFLGAELQSLQAPSSRQLWHACTRQEWIEAYNIHLAEWSSGGLSIDELWPLPPESDQRAVDDRRKRVDQWLEDVDELGTMLFAVTGTTHGC